MMLKKHGAAAGHIGAIAETRAKKIASIRERWRALKGFRAVGIGASMIGSHCARAAANAEAEQGPAGGGPRGQRVAAVPMGRRQGQEEQVAALRATPGPHGYAAEAEKRA